MEFGLIASLAGPLFAQGGALPTSGISWWSAILNLLIIILGTFLILLVLIQRGKGGGLAGAFGGVGGSSAFGSRAGDLFTRITLAVAGAWILLIMVHVKVIQGSRSVTASAPITTPADQADQ